MERNLKELLIKIRDSLKPLFENVDADVDGICLVIDTLYYRREITLDELEILYDYLDDNLPPREDFSQYCWEVSEIEPRLKWLDEQIEKL